MAPVAAYSGDEVGNTVIDYVGSNNFSIIGSNVIRNPAGHTNGGLSSNGSATAQMPDIGETPNRTFMMWFKGIELISDGWIVQWYVPSIDSGAWGLLKLTGQIHIQARNAGGLARASAALPADNSWHHFAGTFDGTNIRLYIDGILVATTPLAGPLRVDSNAPVFGGWPEAGPVSDDIRIDNAVLDGTAITGAMNTPVGAVTVAGSISDVARQNMLTALGLTEPQSLSNVDLMRQVVAAGGLAIITVTNATPAIHLERYLKSLKG